MAPEPTNPSDPRRPAPRANPAKKPEPNALALMGVGLELGAVVAVLTLGGWWLDGQLGTGPWLLLSGAAVGIVGGIYNVWRQAKRFF